MYLKTGACSNYQPVSCSTVRPLGFHFTAFFLYPRAADNDYYHYHIIALLIISKRRPIPSYHLVAHFVCTTVKKLGGFIPTVIR